MSNEKVFDAEEFSQHLRPAWTPLNIGLMVLFFVVGLWPLGLAAIVYMAYGRQMGIDFSNWGKAQASVGSVFEKAKRAAQPEASTGNAAFDEWRAEEMARLEQERRRLDAARKEFDDYVRELRKARDREEFDAFRARYAARDRVDEDDNTIV